MNSLICFGSTKVKFLFAAECIKSLSKSFPIALRLTRAQPKLNKSQKGKKHQHFRILIFKSLGETFVVQNEKHLLIPVGVTVQCGTDSHAGLGVSLLFASF